MGTFGFFCLVLLHFNAQQQQLSINQFILQAIHFWIRKLSACAQGLRKFTSKFSETNLITSRGTC